VLSGLVKSETKRKSSSNVIVAHALECHAEPLSEESEFNHKAWIVLITCCKSRCVYLDLVPGCTGEECIEALKRFQNKFDTPKIVISDNGTSFTSIEVQNFAASKGISWSFNIASAPWTGGFFERLVRSVKCCLKKILGQSKINSLQMLTMLTEIENVLNNRPLTIQTENPSDASLTPYHLLHGRQMHDENKPESCSTDITPIKRREYLKQLVNHFWKR